MAEEIIAKVRIAASAKVKKRSVAPVGATESKVDAKVLVDQVLARTALKAPQDIPPVVCIGASTGGTVAIEDILSRLPADTTGLLPDILRSATAGADVWPTAAGVPLLT